MERTVPQPPPHRRFAAWWITGPAGHLTGGALDLIGFAGRVLWARARRRELR